MKIRSRAVREAEGRVLLDAARYADALASGWGDSLVEREQLRHSAISMRAVQLISARERIPPGASSIDPAGWCGEEG